MVTCYGTGINERCYYSTWDSWARWVVLALIIIGAFLLFFSFSCLSARRRRRMGHSPYRGTGWAIGRPPPGHGPAQYTTNNQQPYYQNYQNAQPYYNNSNNPPPAYTPPPNNSYYGQNSNNNDVELQQPQPVYGGYQPPKGAPPAHPS